MVLVGRKRRKRSSDEAFKRVWEPYDRTVRIVIVWNSDLRTQDTRQHQLDTRFERYHSEWLQNLLGTFV